jgi:uncharacterized protein (TIGR02646 family)
VIGLPTKDLAPELQALLDTRQARIDGTPDYAAQVDAAKRMRESRPRDRFKSIRDLLTEMCSGEDRCMYCEDSAGDEIEHHRPKSVYPDRTFAWMNLLLACGRCNGSKRARFGVLSTQRRQFVEVARPRGAPPSPPDPARTSMLLDPRREDPLRFMILDLVFPFHFHPLPSRGCLARTRAAYTIEVLGLNRDPLPCRRGNAYENYRLRLREYVAEADPAARVRRLTAIGRLDHPTVWREMQRQHQQNDELRRLFEQAPAALALPHR